MRRAIVKQFENPKGFAGQIAGWIMANRDSNVQRNRWTVDLLQLQAEDHVLEIGPGPGRTLEYILGQVHTGEVTALDHSELMLRKCRRRNRTAVQQGRLSLLHADISNLVTLPGRYDKILAVNSLQFSGFKRDILRTLCGHLKNTGTLAITFQPRNAHATETSTLQQGTNIKSRLQEIGLEDVRIEKMPNQHMPAICVLARWH